MDPVWTVQIELAGLCSAECEFCDWVRRPKEQKIFMDTELAKKCVREARELGAGQISFHITGESLLHPDLLEIMPNDYPILISTNCLPLEGDLACRLSSMPNLLMILAVLWSEPEAKRLRSANNAEAYLKLNPCNRFISLQMICSEHSVPWARTMYYRYFPYLSTTPQLHFFYKQPYTQEVDRPTMGYVPTGIPEGPRVVVDRLPTPQSCGPDCLRQAPNPATDMFIQSDGEIKPCFKRWPHWNIGNIKDMSLREAWACSRKQQILDIWQRRDPNSELACHDCIYMATPINGDAWWLK